MNLIFLKRRKYPNALLKPEDIEKERKEEKWINPVTGIVTSSCGYRNNPVLAKQELHDGLDIAVPTGTEAVAVKSGTVTEVRKSKTFGNLLKYETEDGYTVMYAHLKQALVRKGEKIKQGQVIAETGNTGLSTGAHLHYSVWKGDMLMNPMQFVSLKYTNEVKAEYIARGEKAP